jgi:hypothetical protein
MNEHDFCGDAGGAQYCLIKIQLKIQKGFRIEESTLYWQTLSQEGRAEEQTEKKN